MPSRAAPLLFFRHLQTKLQEGTTLKSPMELKFNQDIFYRLPLFDILDCFRKISKNFELCSCGHTAYAHPPFVTMPSRPSSTPPPCQSAAARLWTPSALCRACFGSCRRHRRPWRRTGRRMLRQRERASGRKVKFFWGTNVSAASQQSALGTGTRSCRVGCQLPILARCCIPHWPCRLSLTRLVS